MPHKQKRPQWLKPDTIAIFKAIHKQNFSDFIKAAHIRSRLAFDILTDSVCINTDKRVTPDVIKRIADAVGLMPDEIVQSEPPTERQLMIADFAIFLMHGRYDAFTFNIDRYDQATRYRDSRNSQRE